MNAINIVHIAGDLAACHRYRAYEPFVALHHAGLFVRYFNPVGKPWNVSVSIPDNTDIILLQRLTHPVFLGFIGALRKQVPNAKIIYEQDDNLFDLAKSNPAYEYFSHKEIRDTIKTFYNMSDAIIVSTDPLGEQLSEFFKGPIFTVPNMINVKTFKPADKDNEFVQQKDGKTVIGIAGSDSHYADIKTVWGVLRYLSETNPNILLHFVGYVPTYVDIDPKTFIRTDWQDIGTYSRAVSSFDIAIAAVQDSKFNMAKSDIKILESGACGVPALASRTASYTNMVSGDIFPTCKNEKDWLRWLQKLIASPQLRYEQAQKQYDHVFKNRNLWTCLEPRLSAYEAITGLSVDRNSLNLTVPEGDVDVPEEKYKLFNPSPEQAKIANELTAKYR